MFGVTEQQDGIQGKGLATWYGNSEEEKPTGEDVVDGSVFVETDTHVIFMYDATAGEWKEW